MTNKEQETAEDYLNGMIEHIYKIRGIARLFEVESSDGGTSLDGVQSNGIAFILEDIAKELKASCDKAIECL